jgi:hypothetical protein
MTLKSDQWIRRMALERRMIEPFEPGQVKEVGGRRVVSYGTSSYGYDIRCSRIQDLYHINSTIVGRKTSTKELRRLPRRGMHHSAELRSPWRAPWNTGSPQRADHLPGQVHLRALRHRNQRDAARASGKGT